MRRGTCWTLTGPALSVCSELTRLPPAAWTTASRKRRSNSGLAAITVYVCGFLTVSSVFSTDAASEPGVEMPEPVQHGPHLQPVHEPEELCL